MNGFASATPIVHEGHVKPGSGLTFLVHLDLHSDSVAKRFALSFGSSPTIIHLDGTLGFVLSQAQDIVGVTFLVHAVLHSFLVAYPPGTFSNEHVGANVGFEF